MKKTLVFCILLIFLLCGCGLKTADYIIRPSSVPAKRVTKTAVAPAAKLPEELPVLSDDPWGQCAAARNSEVTPEKITNIENDEFRRRLQITFEIQEEAAARAYIAHRCMNGKLYACQISPNTNCAERLNFTPDPNEAMRQFCSDPDLEGSIISPVISKINSAYEWRCHEGIPVITAQLAESDAAGYDKSIWFEIPQPE